MINNTKKMVQRDIKRLKKLDASIANNERFYSETWAVAAKSMGVFLLSFTLAYLPSALFSWDSQNIAMVLLSISVAFMVILVVHAFLFPTFSRYVRLKRAILPKLSMGVLILERLQAVKKKFFLFVLCLAVLAKALFFLGENNYDATKILSVFAVLYFVPTLIFFLIMFDIELKKLQSPEMEMAIKSLLKINDGKCNRIGDDSDDEDVHSVTNPLSMNNPINSNSIYNPMNSGCDSVNNHWK